MTRIPCLWLLMLVTAPLAARAEEAGAPALAALYARAAADIKQGRPLVVTVHVALCDNRVIWCGGKGLGNGDEPRRNLYWGGAAGFRAYFDRARGYKRVHLDDGDGEAVIQRAVYRFRVARPSGAWRKLGVSGGFDVLVVGLGYRGTLIAQANDQFIQQVAGQGGQELRLATGETMSMGGLGHVVGYAGHNHLMDVRGYPFPRVTRTAEVGYFALSCMNASYLARPLSSVPGHALLLTRTFMYPGAFTIDGLVRGIAVGEAQREVFAGGAGYYARFQKRPERVIRAAFIHDGERRFQKYLEQ